MKNFSKILAFMLVFACLVAGCGSKEPRFMESEKEIIPVELAVPDELKTERAILHSFDGQYAVFSTNSVWIEHPNYTENIVVYDVKNQQVAKVHQVDLVGAVVYDAYYIDGAVYFTAFNNDMKLITLSKVTEHNPTVLYSYVYGTDEFERDYLKMFRDGDNILFAVNKERGLYDYVTVYKLEENISEPVAAKELLKDFQLKGNGKAYSFKDIKLNDKGGIDFWVWDKTDQRYDISFYSTADGQVTSVFNNGSEIIDMVRNNGVLEDHLLVWNDFSGLECLWLYDIKTGLNAGVDYEDYRGMATNGKDMALVFSDDQNDQEIDLVTVKNNKAVIYPLKELFSYGYGVNYTAMAEDSALMFWQADGTFLAAKMVLVEKP